MSRKHNPKTETGSLWLTPQITLINTYEQLDTLEEIEWMDAYNLSPIKARVV